MTIYNPDTSACWDSADSLVRSSTITRTDVHTQSLYASDTVELTRKLTLNLGLRLDHYGITKGNGTTYFSRDDTMTNGNIGLTWKARENGMAYLAYATSSNPMGQELDGGGGDYAGLDANSQLLSPEENTSLLRPRHPLPQSSF